MVDIENIPTRSVKWHPCFKIIPSRFAPIAIFERVANEAEFEALYVIEQLTNDRLRDEIGDLNLVPKAERLYGEGTSMIMAAFTHLPTQGSRFTDGSYGVYYAGKNIETAISETKYWREKFLSDFDSPPIELDMRVLLADLKAKLHVITSSIKVQHPEIYHSNNYQFSQELGKNLRGEGSSSFGIKYESVRHSGGECVALFRPKALSNCRQERHLCYVWDGHKISNIYKKELGY